MTSRYLRTSDIARAVGVHPNTVRLYEAWGFLPPVPRSPKGYRLFTETHLDHMRLARTALQAPYPGGKRPVLAVVEHAVAGDLGGALENAYAYLAQVQGERAQAEAAVAFLERWAAGGPVDATAVPLQIGQAARLLALSPDILRNWERDGLIGVPRNPTNGYRLSGAPEIGRLRVIRTLRRAGYSTMAVLRMILSLDRGHVADLRQALDTPRPDEEIYSAADRWLSTLSQQEQRARDVIHQVEAMLGKSRPR
jgi:DNA-binding transcriptional MerR regulator